MKIASLTFLGMSLSSRHNTVTFPVSNSKIYDSLLATPSVRTPPTSRSRGSSVSQHSATNRWRRSRVTLKYSETKCECWRSVLIYLLMFNTNTYKSIHDRICLPGSETMGTMPWVWVRVRVLHVKKSLVRVRDHWVWVRVRVLHVKKSLVRVRDHIHGYRYKLLYLGGYG